MNRGKPWAWIALFFGLGGAGLAWYLHTRELELQEWRLREAQWRERKQYDAQTVPCSLRFARGGVLRVTAYDESFRWQGLLPELAHGSDDSEGETWAEFYALGDAAAAAGLMARVHADPGHLLLRQRLVFHYFLGRNDESQALAMRELLRAEDSGWSLRVAWVETPHGLARVAPPATAYAPAQSDSRLSEWRRLEDSASPEVNWRSLDGGQHPDRDAWYEAQRKLERDWSHDPRRLAEARERYAREHVHFHLVEAARRLGDADVLVLRRFGPIQGGTTLARSMDEIAAMTASLRCAPR